MNMVRTRDDAPKFSSQGEYQPWASAVADASRERSRFENLALLAGKSPPRAGDLPGLLLASALPLKNRGCEVLRPLWTEEAMHRAHGFMRLVDARNRRGQSTRENPITVGVEDFVARDLAMRFRELETDAERAMVPCSGILRDVVASLGALFGCPANIALETRIDRLSLPAYKRRALVLATCELFCNALLHAFQGRERGAIEVDLTPRGHGSASLRVADDGIGFCETPPDLTHGVAAGLAGLLEADLVYDRVAGWTIVEIVFPVCGP